jgi:hypothetical protein
METKICVTNDDTTNYKINKILEKYDSIEDIDNLMEKNLEKIKTYQHERMHCMCEDYENKNNVHCPIKKNCEQNKNASECKPENIFSKKNLECIKRYQHNRTEFNNIDNTDTINNIYNKKDTNK